MHNLVRLGADLRSFGLRLLGKVFLKNLLVVGSSVCVLHQGIESSISNFSRLLINLWIKPQLFLLGLLVFFSLLNLLVGSISVLSSQAVVIVNGVLLLDDFGGNWVDIWMEWMNLLDFFSLLNLSDIFKSSLFKSDLVIDKFFHSSWVVIHIVDVSSSIGKVVCFSLFKFLLLLDQSISLNDSSFTVIMKSLQSILGLMI